MSFVVFPRRVEESDVPNDPNDKIERQSRVSTPKKLGSPKRRKKPAPLKQKEEQDDNIIVESDFVYKKQTKKADSKKKKVFREEEEEEEEKNEDDGPSDFVFVVKSKGKKTKKKDVDNVSETDKKSEGKKSVASGTPKDFHYKSKKVTDAQLDIVEVLDRIETLKHRFVKPSEAAVRKMLDNFALRLLEEFQANSSVQANDEISKWKSFEDQLDKEMKLLQREDELQEEEREEQGEDHEMALYLQNYLDDGNQASQHLMDFIKSVSVVSRIHSKVSDMKNLQGLSQEMFEEISKQIRTQNISDFEMISSPRTMMKKN